jgi:hypothetical protein
MWHNKTPILVFFSVAGSMSAFPPDWEVDELDDYDSYHLSASEDEQLCAKLLLPLSSDYRATGAFRILVFGYGFFSVELPVRKLFTPTPAEFAGHFIVITFTVENLSPQANSVATAWVDVVDLLKDRSARMTDLDQKPVDHTAFVQHMTDAAAAKKANLGASIRWALAVSKEGKMQFELQHLPVPPKLLNKQNLKQDNAVSVLLLDILAKMYMFQDPLVAGPVPHLFAEDTNECYNELQGDVSGLLDDIRTINKKFLVMEHMTLQEAVQYMAGRHRAARGTAAFTVSAPVGPAAKRQRHMSAASSDSGVFS